MRAKFFLLMAFLVAMSALAIVPGALPEARAQVVVPPWGHATERFYAEIRLDQVREQLLVELGMTPNHSLVFIEVQTTVYQSVTTKTTTVDFHPIFVDSTGMAQITVPLNASPDLIDYQIRAHALRADGVVESTDPWALLSRPVGSSDDIEALASGLIDDLERELEDSAVALSDTSPIGISFNNFGLSRAFIASGTRTDPNSAISGPGTVYTALPMNSMRLSSGPAGVFTAN